MKYYIGLDIGGTKIAIILADENIKIIEKIEFLTFYEFNDNLIKIIETVNYFKKKYNYKITSIGISAGGPLDSEKGIFISPPHLKTWHNKNIKKFLEDELNIPSFLENDANACALAEFYYGNGKGSKNMAFLTFGTGLGAGLILDGKIYRGSNNQAGEIGHIRIAENGPFCYGKNGCVESYCCGAGISKLHEKLTGEKLTTEQIFIKAEKQKNKGCINTINISSEKLGLTLSILIDLLALDTIIIGSIYSRNQDIINKIMLKKITEEVLEINKNLCKVKPSFLKENIGDYASIIVAKRGCFSMNRILNELINRYPILDYCCNDIEKSFEILKNTALNKNKILTCGNGGSSSDSDHIVGELMKSFVKKRPIDENLKKAIKDISPEDAPNLNSKLQKSITAISLSQHPALSSAFGNDVDPSMIYAQQVQGYGREGDTLICLSSSGNSKNVVLAAITAKAKGLNVIGLTGQNKSKIDQYCDVVIKVPQRETFKVQELHLPVYHALCLMLEDSLW